MNSQFSKQRTGVVALIGLLLLLLYFFWPVQQGFLYPRCVFHELTGLYCPGCGSQRAFSALVHGGLIAAAGYNLLFVVFGPIVVYGALVYAWNSFFSPVLPMKFFYSPRFAWLVLTFTLVFWILRNLPVEPFCKLAP